MPHILQPALDWAMDPDRAYAFQQNIAYAMVCFLVLALLFRALTERPQLLRAYDSTLHEKLKLPSFRARWRRIIDTGLLVCALVVMTSYFLRAAPGGRFFHHWDVFHTAIGAKYHNELGYFDFYRCSLAIDRSNQGYFRSVKEMRDLRTRKYVPVEEHANYDDCAARFSPDRLEEFKTDLSHFGPTMHGGDWQRLFLDKGFNGTPFYTVVAASLVQLTDGSINQLTVLTLLDPLLMVAAFCAVAWAFGLRQAALLAIFFCTFFPNRFVHMGGSILRFDYIAALVVGMAALKKEKWGVCAVLFAWATMVRVFPAIFAFALGIKILADSFQHRKLSRPHIIFAAGYVGTLCLLALVSFAMLEGPVDDYVGWWQNMKIHTEKSASFRVGFRHLFMIRGSLEKVHYGAMERSFQERWLAYALCSTMILLPILLAVRKLDKVSFTAIFGAVGFYLFVISTRYYYAAFALLFLIDRDFLRNRTLLLAALTAFAASTFDFFYFSQNSNTALMYNFILGAQILLVVLILIVGLLFDPGLNDDAPTLPPKGSERLDAPETAPAQVASAPCARNARNITV